MKKWSIILIGLFLFSCLQAQILEPIQVDKNLKKISDTEYELQFNVSIAEGWHVYSTNLGDDGPVSASLNVEKKEGITLIGELITKGKEISIYDKLFGMDVRYFENNVLFTQKLKIVNDNYKLEGYFEYAACDDQTCLPPTKVEFSYVEEDTQAASVQEVKKNTPDALDEVEKNKDTEKGLLKVEESLSSTDQELT